MTKLALIFLLFFLNISLATAAEIRADITPLGGRWFIVSIHFDGDIAKGDLKAIKQMMSRLNGGENDYQIILNSPGGDVQEAMKIGEYLRKNEFKVILPINCN